MYIDWVLLPCKIMILQQGKHFFLFRKIHGRITSVILILFCVQIECELFIYFTTRGIDYYIFITNELLGCVLPGYGLNIKMSSWEVVNLLFN